MLQVGSELVFQVNLAIESTVTAGVNQRHERATMQIAGVELLVGVEWLDELGPGACNRGRFADDARP